MPCVCTTISEQDSSGILFYEAGVDVTIPTSIDSAALWKGVTQVSLVGIVLSLSFLWMCIRLLPCSTGHTLSVLSPFHTCVTTHPPCLVQVVSLLGPRFGPQPDGSMGYYDNMSPDRVEGGGVCGCIPTEVGWMWVAGLLHAAGSRQLNHILCHFLYLFASAVRMRCLSHYNAGPKFYNSCATTGVLHAPLPTESVWLQAGTTSQRSCQSTCRRPSDIPVRSCPW